MLSRIYLEITNICNRSCAFCPGTKRTQRMLTVEEFSFLAARLRPYTDYLYLHVMGEPLIHPHLREILARAGELGFRVIVTTNGTLLPQQQDTLLAAECLHKVHISLHSFEANQRENFEEYVRGCTEFGLAAQKRGILINYRLWNLDGAETVGQRARNDEILQSLRTAFPEPWKENTQGFCLTGGVFLQYGEKFAWPDLDAADHGDCGFCYALRTQAAVLCDGTVVPCCLDHEGDLALGNLFEQNMDQILQSPLAREIRDGFSARKRTQELCRRCGFSTRFDT